MKQKKMILTNKNNFTSNSYLISSSNTTQISNSYSNIKQLLEQARKISENSFQSMSSIQSSNSEAENILDVELFDELVRQFPIIWNPKLNWFNNLKIIHNSSIFRFEVSLT